MWFGTRGGLNRYDAYELIHHKPKADAVDLISNPSIETVFEDSKGNLWIGTKSGGLNHFDTKTEKFSHIQTFGRAAQFIEDNRVICIAETENGNILVGTWSNGLYVLDQTRDTLLHFHEGLQVNNILVEDDQNIWVATNGTLFNWNLLTNTVKEIDLGGIANVTELIADDDGSTLWMVGWELGLLAYNKNDNTIKRHFLKTKNDPLDSDPNNTYSILKDSNGKLWIGTWNSGLFVYDAETEDFNKIDLLPAKSNLQSNELDIILDIYEDNTGNIWIGTDSGGIVRLGTNRSFQSVSREEQPQCGLSNFHINSFWKTENGILYLGTRGGGLYRTRDNRRFEPVEIEGIEERVNSVKNIYPIAESTVWVSYDDRCFQMDVHQNGGVVRPIEDNSINAIRKITAITKTDKSLFIGTQQSGLYYFPDFYSTDNFLQYTPQNNEILQNERITFVKEDSQKRTWLGTFKGVYFFDQTKREIVPLQFVEGQFLTGDIINCWHQTNDSVFWLGTPSGLNKLTLQANGSFSVQNIYSDMGLADDYILGILSDNKEEIWVCTSSGVVRINVEDEKISTFDKSDGLPSLNFAESQGYIAGDGTMYFGTTNGYLHFKSEDIAINEAKPPVVFTRFKIYNTEIRPGVEFNGKVFLEESVNTNPEIQLSHKEKEFTIEFSALNYNSPQRNRYSYKMEGYDDDWVVAGDKRAVTYINLRPGEYKFQVRGSNNNYVWNMEGISLPIIIKPAPWETWYAIILYVLVITALVLLIRWNAVKQVRLANSLEMEKVEHEQEHRINEMKLRFFTNVSHEFRTPLTLILGPTKEMLESDEDNRLARIVHKNARRLMGLVNQLLEFRRIETDNLQLRASKNNLIDFVNELCISFEELAKINQIKFEVLSDIKNKELWFDIEKMEMVLNNLISNAFKYAGSGAEVQILLSESEQWVQVHVCDNGPGINPNEIGHIFERFYQSDKNKSSGTGIGLNLVKQLVKLHHGEIEVSSEPNKKTEFVVKLRKGETHFSGEEKADSTQLYPSFIGNKGTPSQSMQVAKNMEIFDKKQSLLVVEDNHEIREYLLELLGRDYKVSTAENGKIGYEFAIVEEFDLIVSDILMPEMDGLELCQKLKSNMDTSHVPVILLTAKSAGRFRLEGLGYGAEAYISKPFNPDELKTQIYSILSARQKVKQKFGKTITLEPTELEITLQEELFIKKVIQSIEKNIDNSEFTSEDLAKLTGTSTTTLYRKLKSLTGQSSNELIRSIRLKRAAQFLKDTQNTVSEITYMVGFNDVKYFRKCFQKQFDLTPSEFRKGHDI